MAETTPTPEEKTQEEKDTGETLTSSEATADAGQPGPEAAGEPVDIYALLRYCVALLHGHAWQCLGLVPNPVTRTVQQDLEQARVAIDATASLLPHLEGAISAQEWRELQSLLNDLRVNFVQQKGKAS